MPSDPTNADLLLQAYTSTITLESHKKAILREVTDRIARLRRFMHQIAARPDAASDQYLTEDLKRLLINPTNGM